MFDTDDWLQIVTNDVWLCVYDVCVCVCVWCVFVCLCVCVVCRYFGLGEDQVTFFSQGTLPCLTTEGKIMLESSSHVAEAPDGNGGIYRALHVSGSVEKMQNSGVKYVHAFAVDNAVCKVADPYWVGYCIERAADMGCKVRPKVSPDEKVGVLCRRGGKFSVVEYSDLDDVSKNKRYVCLSLYTYMYICACHYIYIWSCCCVGVLIG